MTDASSWRLVADTMPQLLPMARAPGVHVSDIIHHLCVSLGHFTERGGNVPPSTLARFELGNMMERALVDRLAEDEPGRYHRCAEIEHDGIIGNPDLLDVEAGDGSEVGVTEIKLTWMSSKREPDSEKFWRYEVQVKAYCWMLGVAIGRLRVCFLNGDYRWGEESGGPQYREWERRFREEELAANWRMLKNNAEAL